MNKLVVAAALSLSFTCSALAQGLPDARAPSATGTVVQGQSSNTGSGRGVIIAPSATGAETITTDSAAGGNAGQPSRAVPQGSSGSGGNGSGGQ
ncbi:hypothetical protein DK389_08580 [Methylobacterium durans]|uniref:Lipoprotein n=1 Tax=Methylobacterium durans TaxID=2202825 RepID=A0A2U8W4M5_9HYPH|nr:hypothetical protein [Methylobacterium durans]AWN40578.1 hypothetical protein DK389_08580 [Methylobacterium durans]